MTLEEAIIARDAAKAAWLAALNARQVSHGESTVGYQDVATLYQQYADLDRAVQALTAQAAGALRPLVSTARWTR